MKAVGLFSGGLDSALAIKLIKDQGIEVIAFHYSTPFVSVTKQGTSIKDLAKKLGVKIKIINTEKKYINIVKNPKHGHGKNINPCIDCKIFILKQAKKCAKKIGAKFIFTGEVLGQRPMSQHYKTLMLIEKEAGLKSKLVRPLSIGLLPETQAEKKGWINKKNFPKIQGRTRRIQLELAKKYKLEGFLAGTSGCRLTDKEYSIKARDLFENKKRTTTNDIQLLSLGRHFRKGKNKIIVGRNKIENEFLVKLKSKSDYMFEAKDVMGPTTLLQGLKTKKAIELAARLTARYSDAKSGKVTIRYGKEKLNKEICVSKITESKIRKLRR